MEKRNKRAFIILLVLVGVNLIFFFSGGKNSEVSFDEQFFVVSDTSSVRSIEIIGSQEVKIERGPNSWQLNEAYKADQGLVRLILSIMQRVQVKKPVVIEAPEDATTVTVNSSDPLSFLVWGNSTKTKTYFKKINSEDAYEVGIPGYNEYLGQIFELTLDQWRNRLVIDASWRTIQEVTLDYLGDDDKDFTIRFDDAFFRVDQISSLDSSAVVDYLNQFQYFEANEWISSGRFSRYDSLSIKPPIATVTISTINSPDPLILDIYPVLNNEPYHLVENQDGDLMVIDRNRMLGILRNRSDFGLDD